MIGQPPLDPASLLTAERCERLRDTFDLVVEQPAELREAWIQSHVPDVDDRAALALLLAAELGEGPLDTSPDERMRRLLDDPDTSPEGLIGRQIGAFRLVRLLGQGGMSTVFLGEREGAEFKQRAAVKLLRRGLYSPVEQRLFRREQQALASLSHPNIARFIDGGVSEAGVPYLVIEYIDGVALTQYAAEHRLSISQRLRLFVVICRAVAAAHRQLIVHRDLKPSNILVDRDGEVKLLDFGIAKLLDDGENGATRTALVAMTPDYAAPEQFSGDTITTATDVYALGVVLHELLLGQRPPSPDGDGRLPSSRISSESQESDAALPAGTLRAAVKGDLDNILLKALAMEPERRYASAADLGDDIERHLSAQPVNAHPPSRWYRTRKFMRRHRGSVALTLAFSLGVLISLALAIWQAEVARREAANARAEAVRANTTRDFLERLFEPVREQLAEGVMPSLRDLVGEGVRQLDGNVELEPTQRIDLLLMFSRLQSQLADSEASKALAERAHTLAVRHMPKDSALRIEAVFAHGRTLLQSGNLVASEPFLREVERWQEAHHITGPDAIELYGIMARWESESDRPDQALRYAERDLQARIDWYGKDSAQSASGYNNLGYALEATERFDEAIPAYRKSLEIDDRFRNPRSLQRAYPLGNLAQALFNAGRLPEARDYFAEVLTLHKDVAFEKPPRILLGQLAMLGETLLALGDLSAAETTIAEYRGWAEMTPKSDVDRAIVARQTARLALERGDIRLAEQLLEDLPDLLDDVPDYTRRRSEGWRNLLLAEIALLEGRYADAQSSAIHGMKGIGDVYYPPYVIRHARALAALACAQSPDPECAENLTALAQNSLADAPYHEHPALILARIAMARIDLLQGNPGSAITRLRSIIESSEQQGVLPDSPRLKQAYAWFAAAMAHTGDCAKAASALDRAGVTQAGVASHPFVNEAYRAYVATDCHKGRASDGSVEQCSQTFTGTRAGAVDPYRHQPSHWAR